MSAISDARLPTQSSSLEIENTPLAGFEPNWEEMDRDGDLEAALAEKVEPISLAAPPKFPVDKILGPIQSLVRWGQIDGLHAEAVGMAAIGALSATLAGSKHVKAPTVLPSLWIAIIGTRSSGKSPAMRHCFESLMHQPDLGPPEAPILLTDATCAAVPQELSNSYDSITVLADELTGFLSGFGATSNDASQGAISDLSFFRACWSGAYIRRTRVSTGTLIIPNPHLSIIGGLLPGRTAMLGSSRDGDLARWLPTLVPSITPQAPTFQQDKPSDWVHTIDRLRGMRGHLREWKIDGDGWAIYDHWRKKWYERQNSDVAEHVSSGLSKAADQAARVAIVFAESIKMGEGGEIPYPCVLAACEVVDYSMRCWEAMLPPGVSALDYDSAARALASAVNELMELVMYLIPDPDGIRRITKRRLLQRNACRIRNSAQMDKLISAYEKVNPGCVVREQTRGGHERVIVREPFRKPAK